MFRATLDTFSQVFLKDYKYNIIDIGGFMSKISNVLTMLQLLQSGKKYSISELSNELEVSERMIRVYKEDLEKAGIYIDAIIGPYGWYVLNQSVRMPVRKFKMKDAKLLDKYIESEKDKDIKDEQIENIFIKQNNWVAIISIIYGILFNWLVI